MPEILDFLSWRLRGTIERDGETWTLRLQVEADILPKLEALLSQDETMTIALDGHKAARLGASMYSGPQPTLAQKREWCVLGDVTLDLLDIDDDDD